jgi:hypothetical protein
VIIDGAHPGRKEPASPSAEGGRVNSTAPGDVLVSAASSCLGQRRVGLRRRLLGIGPNPSTKAAELIGVSSSSVAVRPPDSSQREKNVTLPVQPEGCRGASFGA